VAAHLPQHVRLAQGGEGGGCSGLPHTSRDCMSRDCHRTQAILKHNDPLPFLSFFFSLSCSPCRAPRGRRPGAARSARRGRRGCAAGLGEGGAVTSIPAICLYGEWRIAHEICRDAGVHESDSAARLYASRAGRRSRRRPSPRRARSARGTARRSRRPSPARCAPTAVEPGRIVGSETEVPNMSAITV
jgi:hypothetical protein